MGGFQQIGFVFTLLVVSIAAVNRTEDARTGKSLGIFNVIQFPNTACTGSAGLNGTCYTSDECTAKGGVSSGTCASSFGVCCTFSLACGSTTSENCTYHSITAFSTATDASPCKYTVCPTTTDVCKLRIDFEAFSIASPFTTAATDATLTSAAILLSQGYKTGDCTTDQFTVTNPSGTSPPVICGTNAGQHIWVDADSACNELNFNIDTLTSTTRSWTLKVTQHNCGAVVAGDSDCLQYLTGTSGTFASFNFDTTATTVANGPTMQHLNDQYYDVCFRREENYCSICFSPGINTVTTTPSFGVSASEAAAAAQSSNEIKCGITEFYEDYINVDGLHVPVATSSSLLNAAGTDFAERVCGQIFAVTAAATTAVTACSYRVPFKWGVHFDDKEVVLAAGIANLNNHDTAQGAIGFYMNYWQVACS